MFSAVPDPQPATCVLIVEDEPGMCDLISELVECAGLRAHCETSDEAAYAALRNETFSALIVDINLRQGTTGYDVARFARQTSPRLPVIYVSGQSSRRSLAANGVEGGAFLEKPFTAGQLLGLMRDLLDAEAHGRRDRLGNPAAAG